MTSLPLQQYTKLFRAETMPNINAYAKPLKLWPQNWSCLAVDMGGTNCRSARVSFDYKGNAKISEFKICPMPGSLSPVTWDELMVFYEDIKRQYGEDKAAFCFSYPAEIMPDGSAKVIRFAKGVVVKNAEGQIINDSVVNDTVATLLGTKNANMGMVLGTGFNIAFLKNGNTVNSECGICQSFPTEAFDIGTEAQMQVSGAYINPLLKKTKDIADPQFLYDRAGKIVASIINGIAEYAKIKEIRLACEGSVYWNLIPLQYAIQKYTMELKPDIKFLDGRDTTLIGAAVALYERSNSLMENTEQ